MDEEERFTASQNLWRNQKEEKDAKRNGNNGALNLFQDREHNRDSVKNSQFALSHISAEAADIQSQKN